MEINKINKVDITIYIQNGSEDLRLILLPNRFRNFQTSTDLVYRFGFERYLLWFFIDFLIDHQK